MLCRWGIMTRPQVGDFQVAIRAIEHIVSYNTVLAGVLNAIEFCKAWRVFGESKDIILHQIMPCGIG